MQNAFFTFKFNKNHVVLYTTTYELLLGNSLLYLGAVSNLRPILVTINCTSALTITVLIAEMDLGPLSGPLSLFHKCVHIKGIKYHRLIVLNEIYQPY